MDMTLGNKIATYRKKLGITQEGLAKKLDVTNQAVSKWESDQCCPDIVLLPKIADIFGISLDELFDRKVKTSAALPWEDDGVLRAVLFIGKRLVSGHPSAQEIHFCYEGPALNVSSEFSVSCDDVNGNVNCGGSVTCDDVHGSISAGGSVTCDDVDGNVNCGGNVSCDCIDGNVRAGGNVTCDEINGDITGASAVYCDHF